MSAGMEVRVNAAVPLVDLAAQQRDVHEEVMAGLDDVFTRASFIGGPTVAEFEAAYARFLGAGHCVGVANGTDALELALRASGVGPGGEVIIPANTFIATAEAASRIVVLTEDTGHPDGANDGEVQLAFVLPEVVGEKL